jgi:hypothetical protein
MSDIAIPANTLVVYVGGRPLSSLNSNFPPPLAASSDEFSGGPTDGITLDPQGIVRKRGQSRYSTWGGSISFNSNNNWYFGPIPKATDRVPNNTYDFYTTALHELIHVLGFATDNNDPTTIKYKSSPYWTGPEVEAANNGKPRLLDSNRPIGLHFSSAGGLVNGRWPVMTLGQSYLPWTNRVVTRLDFAALRDLGWDVSTASAGDLESQARYTGTPQTDRVVWRPTTGTWYVSQTASGGTIQQQWGLPGDVPVSGDFNGDGKTEFAVWRPSNGTWYVRTTSGTVQTVQWGLPGDIPVPGDFNGDGRTEFAVWRPPSPSHPSGGTWYVMGGMTQDWGQAGDIPVQADYDGDGVTDFAVWRPSTGTWYVINSSGGVTVQPSWGRRGDVPVPADYDNDGKADFAVWRPSEGNWYIIRSSDGGVITRQWGLPTDTPQPADFDGDGQIDFAVWRPSEGKWYTRLSSTGTTTTQQWGLPGDVALANAQAAQLARLARS